jgi:hypothetical protein
MARNLVAESRPKRRVDLGNLYPTVKACIDGLVDAKVVDDDDETHVVLVSFATSARVPAALAGMELTVTGVPA